MWLPPTHHASIEFEALGGALYTAERAPTVARRQHSERPHRNLAVATQQIVSCATNSASHSPTTPTEPSPSSHDAMGYEYVSGRSTPSSHPGTPKTCHDESPQDRAAIAGDPPPFGGCSPDPPNGPPRATGRPLAALYGAIGRRDRPRRLCCKCNDVDKPERSTTMITQRPNDPNLPPRSWPPATTSARSSRPSSRFDTETPAWGGVHPVSRASGRYPTAPSAAARRSASGSARPRTVGHRRTATPPPARPTGRPSPRGTADRKRQQWPRPYSMTAARVGCHPRCGRHAWQGRRQPATPRLPSGRKAVPAGTRRPTGRPPPTRPQEPGQPSASDSLSTTPVAPASWTARRGMGSPQDSPLRRSTHQATNSSAASTSAGP